MLFEKLIDRDAKAFGNALDCGKGDVFLGTFYHTDVAPAKVAYLSQFLLRQSFLQAKSLQPLSELYKCFSFYHNQLPFNCCKVSEWQQSPQPTIIGILFQG